MGISSCRSKILAALLAGGIFVAFVLAIGLFNLATARWLYPEYHAHSLGSEFLLQIPLTSSRTYTITMECGAESRRQITVREWNSRDAMHFALDRSPGCSRAISVDRWRKRGRA